MRKTAGMQQTRERNNLMHIINVTSRIWAIGVLLLLGLLCTVSGELNGAQILSSENFTFAKNGSFIQIDAGRDWPFNSRREISFKFRTKSPHGLLLYQTFDHNKLSKDEQDTLDLFASSAHSSTLIPDDQRQQVSALEQAFNAKLVRYSESGFRRVARHVSVKTAAQEAVATGSAGTIAATASQKLVDSLFSSSTASAINSKPQLPVSGAAIATNAGRHIIVSSPSMAASKSSLGVAGEIGATGRLVPIDDRGAGVQVTRRLFAGESRRSRHPLDEVHQTLGTEPVPTLAVIADGSTSAPGSRQTVLSSSAMNSINAALYELYLKLENGRLKLMYEFGARLNQTYCGKGLNDDRWHKVDLRVDPDSNHMTLMLDNQIQVEFVLASQITHDSELVGAGGESRRTANEFVVTNSVLYLGGLDTNAQILRNVKQRLYMAQFTGCIGSILLKTDQHLQADHAPQAPVSIDKLVAVQRGCIDRCAYENYCLHNGACVNHYSHATCDCLNTNHEDVYCWQSKLATLSMFGHSTLVYRIYSWKDRHHSASNRLSLEFQTRAQNAILFFAYGDLSNSQIQRTNLPQPSSLVLAPTVLQRLQSSAGTVAMLTQSQQTAPTPAAAPILVQAATQATSQQMYSNYLAVSLANGSLVVELSVGEQPVILSRLLPAASNKNLADNKWHRISFVHQQKAVSLTLDNSTVDHQLASRNSHLYFDPSVFVGAIPQLLVNETRHLLQPLNLRHKFVGCLRSVYFNQHNILLALARRQPSAEFRDASGPPRLAAGDEYESPPAPAALPLTLRSGKSYLKFKLANTDSAERGAAASSSPSLMVTLASSAATASSSPTTAAASSGAPLASRASGKPARIEFEYRTELAHFFLAGGHLRDLSSHDVGGFWTLHGRQHGCELAFTLSSGLSSEPEQVVKVGGLSEEPPAASPTTAAAQQPSREPVAGNKTCRPNEWRRVALDLPASERTLHISTSATPSHSSHSNRTQTVIFERHELRNAVELIHHVQLGGDLAMFGELWSLSFSGCVRNIQINGREFDARELVVSAPHTASGGTAAIGASHNHQNASEQLASDAGSQGYITLDSCQLVNPCATDANPCENNATCRVNELGEPECDCSKTGYIGRRCHFALYKRSCEDLFLSGQRKSAYYLIDVDRNGPLRPIRVRCNMADGAENVETVLGHNLPPEFAITRRAESSHTRVDVTYIAFQHLFTRDGFYEARDDATPATTSGAATSSAGSPPKDYHHSQHDQATMLQLLIGQAARCKQSIKFDCRSAPLELGKRTWLEAQFPARHRISTLAPVASANQSRLVGWCPCALATEASKRCLSGARSCNCDAGDKTWADDSAELTGDSVGVTGIVLVAKQEQLSTSGESALAAETTSPVESQVRITLGELRCIGAQRDNLGEIAFKTSDAYIEIPGWRKGDVSFSFRTASTPPVIILYQLATSRNHGYLRLTLVTETRLLFEFIVNRKPRKLTLTSSHRLNNGEWQSVNVEYDAANLRLTVNDDSILVDLEPQSDHLGTFEGPLFIGGAPAKYLTGDYAKRNGFTGCFRKLEIDGTAIDLRSYLSPSMPAVTSACRPSCTRNLCQNGGRCIEYWGSYECECSNPIAHSGPNCEINLNINSVTFVAQNSYFVQLSNDTSTPPYPAYLFKSVILSVRTYQQTALILYASDHLNNFVQLHKNGSMLALTFNYNSTIITGQVPIGELEASLAMHASDLAPANYSSASALVSAAPAANSTSNPNATIVSMRPQLQGPLAGARGLIVSGSAHASAARATNTSGSGAPIQVKIERHRLRTTFFVNNNFIVFEKPLVILTNYTQNPWTNPELELVRPPRPKMGSKSFSQIFLANVDEYFTTKLPGFTGCVQGLSIDNALLDFNRAHLSGEWKGDYRIGCKMHCDSFPCKNRGVCIENWQDDSIQCKCDATSYVGRLCDEDVAAIFDGHSSQLAYRLADDVLGMAAVSSRSADSTNHHSQYHSHRRANETYADSQVTDAATNSKTNNTTKKTVFQSPPMTSSSALNTIYYFELSLAFSSDSLHSYTTNPSLPAPALTASSSSAPASSLPVAAPLVAESQDTSQASAASSIGRKATIQVLFLLTRTNSSRYFLLGLTQDGSLLVQENFGASMTLSRYIKKPEFNFNDGHRHLVKYTRLNQTIHISVDYQSYLPSMNVAASGTGVNGNPAIVLTGAHSSTSTVSNNFTKHSSTDKPSSWLILIGTASDELVPTASLMHERTGVANLVSYSGCISNIVSKINGITLEPLSEAFGHNLDTSALSDKNTNSLPQAPPNTSINEELVTSKYGEQIVEPHSAQLNSLDSSEVFKPIIARNVEQGRCASFRKLTDTTNERKSLNEPKSSNLILDPKPVYMDPPQLKPFDVPLSMQLEAEHATRNRKSSFDTKFYISLTILLLVFSSSIIYAYLLQVRYRAEKFRCETPFFHKRGLKSRPKRKPEVVDAPRAM